MRKQSIGCFDKEPILLAVGKYSVYPRSQADRRHHVDEKQVQRHVKKAALAADIVKPTSRSTSTLTFI